MEKDMSTVSHALRRIAQRAVGARFEAGGARETMDDRTVLRSG